VLSISLRSISQRSISASCAAKSFAGLLGSLALLVWEGVHWSAAAAAAAAAAELSQSPPLAAAVAGAVCHTTAVRTAGLVGWTGRLW